MMILIMNDIYEMYIYSHKRFLIFHARAYESVFDPTLPKSLSKLASVLLLMSLFSLKTPSTEKSSTLALKPPSN